jgi:membrane-bound ClpP family serine protease
MVFIFLGVAAAALMLIKLGALMVWVSVLMTALKSLIVVPIAAAVMGLIHLIRGRKGKSESESESSSKVNPTIGD